MAITPADIIEAVIDELVMGELGDGIEAIAIERTGEGSLLLDYGPEGRFTLVVKPE